MVATGRAWQRSALTKRSNSIDKNRTNSGSPASPDLADLCGVHSRRSSTARRAESAGRFAYALECQSLSVIIANRGCRARSAVRCGGLLDFDHGAGHPDLCSMRAGGETAALGRRPGAGARDPADPVSPPGLAFDPGRLEQGGERFAACSRGMGTGAWCAEPPSDRSMG